MNVKYYLPPKYRKFFEEDRMRKLSDDYEALLTNDLEEKFGAERISLRPYEYGYVFLTFFIEGSKIPRSEIEKIMRSNLRKLLLPF